MKLRLEPYGPLLEVFGAPQLEIESDATTAAELLAELHQKHPDLQPWTQRIACGRGDELLNAGSRLNENDAIALIPPVSGG